MARNPPRPLDVSSLERLALRYVERFATTRGKLANYLHRKLRERGWDGDGEPPVEALVERFAALNYIDDLAYGQAKAAAMARRGLGARRVEMALREAGLDEADRQAAAPDDAEQAVTAAMALAKRRRIGPYAASVPDQVQRERQLGQMVRGGHDFGLSRRIVDCEPMSRFDEIFELHRELIHSLS
jgi:regulatory protein